jgi:hypothetical protein
MIDLSSFSSMFPSLSSIFADQGSPRVPVQRPVPEDESEPQSAEDSLELSENARERIPSRLSAATFDTTGDALSVPESIAVADDGTYAPTQTSQRLGMSVGFAFNLNIQRQVTATVQSPQASRSTESGTAARLTALESRSLHYQSIRNETRSELAGGFTESRSIQTELFYSRTRELSLSLPAGRAEQFDETRSQVSRSFKLDISMDFSFLGQFSRQSNSISSLDDDLFGKYLDNTSGLSGHGGEAVQSFFDDVDRILEDSEAFVVSSLSSFFDQVADQFGLSTEEAASLEKMVVEEIASFFDDVDSFLSESRNFLAGPAAAPQLPAEPVAEPVDEPVDSPAVETPAVETADPEAEEDPASLLA